MTWSPDRSAPPPVVGRGKPPLSRTSVQRLAIALLATLAAFLFVWLLGVLGLYNLPYAERIIPTLVRGFEITLELIAFVVPFGFAVGFLVGWGRTSKSALVRGLGALYVDFFRSMPPIVLIAFSFLIALLLLQSPGQNPTTARTLALWIGAVALGLHTGAYQAEIVRAGILSVSAGQVEAAEALGMSRGRTMVRVILPQAFRVSLPALGNEFSSVIKDTSLLSVIGWADLTGLALVLVYNGLTQYLYAPLVVWIEVAAFYFVITFSLNLVVRFVEDRYKVPGLEAAKA